MGFSLQAPVLSEDFSLAAPKVDANFTTLQTWGNGNVLDTDLNSPNNAVRRLLFEVGGVLQAGQGPGTFYCVNNQGVTGTGGIVTSMPQVWIADSGLSGQPQDFQVAGKSAFCRIRAVVLTNATAPGITLTFGLYPVTAGAGASGQFILTLGTVVPSSTAAVVTPAASALTAAGSAQFAMPTASGVYTIGFVTNGVPVANSFTGVRGQLYGYNA